MTPTDQQSPPPLSDPAFLPDDAIATIEPVRVRPEPFDPDPSVRRALEALDGPARLTALVNDPYRHTASAGILAAIAETIGPENVRILVATGAHRADEVLRREFERTLAGEMDFAEVGWHDCRSGDLVEVGGVWCGHPWLVQGGPLLAIGSVEPHYFAGFTGAHKTATIGCAEHADIEANHSAALSPRSSPGRFAGNPIHEGVLEMLSALQSVQRVAAVNLVQAGPEILFASGGDVTDSLERAAEVAGDVFIRRIDEPADALILEVTGALGRSLYQSEKGIKNNEHAVRDGGTLVLVARCDEGIGEDDFVGLLREAPTHADAEAIVARRGYRLGDHKAVRLRYLTDPARRNVKIFLVSDGISGAEAAMLGMTKVDTVEAGLSGGGIRPGAHRVYRIRDAGNCCVLPRST